MEGVIKTKLIDKLKKELEKLEWFMEIYNGLYDEEDRRDRIEENISQEAKKIVEKVKEIIEKELKIEKIEWNIERKIVSDAVYWREFIDILHIYITTEKLLTKEKERHKIDECLLVFNRNVIEFHLKLAEIYHEDRVEHYIDKSVEYSYRKYTYRILS